MATDGIEPRLLPPYTRAREQIARFKKPRDIIRMLANGEILQRRSTVDTESGEDNLQEVLDTYDTGIPGQFYQQLGRLRSTGGLEGRVDFEGSTYREKFMLINKLQDYDVLCKIVPQNLEAEFRHIYRIQLTWAHKSDELARTSALTAYWLHRCWTSHPECRSLNLLTTEWPEFPNRVVDLISYDPSNPKSRLKVNRSNGSRGPYCALSYRWPRSAHKSLMLSKSTEQRLSEGIMADELLSVVRDACSFAKGLGIQHIWVDALCILQGPGGDWHIEAEKMASIYTNAVITLAAVDSTSLSEASQERPFLAQQSEVERWASNDDDFSQERIYLGLLNSENFVFRPAGGLDTRGWAFQEKLLSPRVVSLTKEGVFWDCLHHSASDRRPVGILGDFSPNFQESDDRKFKRVLLNTSTLVSREECYWLWRRAVQNYTKRSLTTEGDRLIALTGIIRILASRLDDYCVLGIWRKDALRSLMWFEEPSKYSSEDLKNVIDRVLLEEETKTRESALRIAEEKLKGLKRMMAQGKETEEITEEYKILKEIMEQENARKQRKVEQEKPMMVPSWSWFSTKNPKQYRLRHPHACYVDIKGENISEKATVLKLSSMRQSPRTFDKFSGILRIKGPVVDGYQYADRKLGLFCRRKKEQLEISELGSEDAKNMVLNFRGSYQHGNENPPGFYIGNILPDCGVSGNMQEAKEMVQKIKCLVLFEGGYSEMLMAYYCLLLEPFLGEDPARNPLVGYYRRVGICVFNTRQICVCSEELCTRSHEDYSDCMGTTQIVNLV